MARVETLLEKLLIRVDSGGSQQRDSNTLVDSVETSPESSPPIVTPAADNAPIPSLFDNKAVRVIFCIRDVKLPLACAD